MVNTTPIRRKTRRGRPLDAIFPLVCGLLALGCRMRALAESAPSRTPCRRRWLDSKPGIRPRDAMPGSSIQVAVAQRAPISTGAAAHRSRNLESAGDEHCASRTGYRESAHPFRRGAQREAIDVSLLRAKLVRFRDYFGPQSSARTISGVIGPLLTRPLLS